MKRVSLFPLVAIVLACPAVAFAQPAGPPPVRVTLDEALARGLSSSHRLGDAAARRDAAEAAGAIRHAASLPQLAALAGYTRTNHVDVFGIALPGQPLRVIYPDIPDNYRARLDLQWPVYTAGRLDALERAARAEASAFGQDVATARADLRLEITRAYWALATALESVRVIDEALVRMDAHLRDVRNLFTQGMAPPNDVASVEAQRSRQQMLTIQARAVRDNAAADLARLAGLDAGVPIETVTPLDTPAAPAGDVVSLLAEARENRPERRALTARLGGADERVRAAGAAARPTVAVAGGVDYANPNPRIFPRIDEWRNSWDAGVNVAWPIFDGGRSRAEVAEATATQRSIAERIADFDQALAADVRQRATDLAASRAAIDAAADGVRAAAEARRVVADRFKAGVATNTDVVDAQVALLQAELDRTQAIAAAKLAEARLARAVGR